MNVSAGIADLPCEASFVKRISLRIQRLPSQVTFQASCVSRFALHASRDPLHEESDLATIRHESSGLARAGPRDPALKSFDYI